MFLDGVSRKDQNGEVIWRPTMKSGEYAEPYRFKPFGSTSVVDRKSGQFVKCTHELCPRAEVIPRWGHHGDDHRTNVLKPSKLHGELINRSPFYWSGGLGTLIRKSAKEENKDFLWNFFVYVNSPDTSVHDVPSYKSWLDSWRFSQLLPGDNFLRSGWSEQAYNEHQNIMHWALSNNANSAYNLRIPGLAKYTRDVVGDSAMSFIKGEVTADQLLQKVHDGWEEIHAQEGKLTQLEIYRASLNLDGLDDHILCRHHRDLMDDRNPSICSKYDTSTNWMVTAFGLAASLVVVISLLSALRSERKRRSADAVWQIKTEELDFAFLPEILGRGTFGLVVVATYRGTKVAVKRVIPPKKLQAPSETYYNVHLGLTIDVLEPDEKRMSLHSSTSAAPFPGSSCGASPQHTKLRKDFIAEMRQLAKLRHPNITTVMGKFWILSCTHV